ISNQAKATATGAGKNIFDLSSPTSEVPEEETVVELCQNAAVNITKVVDPTNISAPATLTYTIEVTNEGNVSLTGVVVTDPFTEGDNTPLTLVSGDDDMDGELDLDETWVYSATYAADQDDIDAGDDLVNTAFVN